MRIPSRGSSNKRHQYRLFLNSFNAEVQQLRTLQATFYGWTKNNFTALWVGKWGCSSQRAASTSYHPLGQPLEWSYLFYRVSYGPACMNFVTPSIYRMTELHVVQAKLNSQHACKTSACIQLGLVLRSQEVSPDSCGGVTCEPLFELVIPKIPFGL